ARGRFTRPLRSSEAGGPECRGDVARGGDRAVQLAVMVGRPTGRLDDDGTGGLLRHVVLSEAFVVRRSRSAMARGAAGLYAVVRIRGRRAGILDWRVAGRLRHCGLERGIDRDARRYPGLDLERAGAGSEGDQRLRVVSDGRRLRVGGLRADQIGRDNYGAGSCGGGDREGGGSESEAVSSGAAAEGAGGDRL